MIYIGLGSNLPGKFSSSLDVLHQAIVQLAQHMQIIKQSSFYRTAPVPKSDQPDYINAVLTVRSNRNPASLLQLLHEIETESGRTRNVINEARVIDIDLLDYHSRICNTPALPHPRLQERLFALHPLQEIAPDWKHPATQQHIMQLIESCNAADQRIERLNA